MGNSVPKEQCLYFPDVKRSSGVFIPCREEDVLVFVQRYHDNSYDNLVRYRRDVHWVDIKMKNGKRYKIYTVNVEKSAALYDYFIKEWTRERLKRYGKEVYFDRICWKERDVSKVEVVVEGQTMQTHSEVEGQPSAPEVEGQ